MSIATMLSEVDVSPAVLSDRGAFIRAVRRGIPGAVVQQAIAIVGDRELFVRLLDTTSANLSRFYRKKTLTRADSEDVLDTLRVFQEAVTVFEDEEIAREWLHTRIPALTGERPIDLFDTSEGRSLVRESLRAIEYGEFS
ncbi:MAG: antitoxin Xre/MbcA/ParS toxin-binding domain-containing protein [Cyanobacteria bacterium P01_D01_bin.123]